MRLLLLYLAVFACAACAESNWGAAVDGLQLSILMPKVCLTTNENITFDISIRNSGPRDLLLNGGCMLGNGQQSWDAFSMELSDDTGEKIPLLLHWRIKGGAGRIYFLGLPMRNGASYTLNVGRTDYYLGIPDHLLKTGKYRMTCTYSGVQSKYRDQIDLPECWVGKLVSNEVKFEVKAE